MSRPLDTSAKGRLQRRAQVVTRVQHPNLARMLPLPGGAGLSPVSNGARRLAELATPDGAFRGLPLEQLIWVLLDVLSGLRTLHEVVFEGTGFVHGAVSPQYILLDEPGSSRLVPLTNAHLMPNVACERNGYVSPELLLGDTADRRADLFSVGVLLWEALAGRRLFPDGSREAVVERLDRGEIPRLAGVVTATWALPLCAVAERAIAATALNRFDSALDFSSAIIAAAGRQLTSPPGTDHARAAAAEPAPRESSPRPARARSVTPPATVIDIPEPVAPAARVSEPVAARRRRPSPLNFALVGGVLAGAGWWLSSLAPSSAGPRAAATELSIARPTPAPKNVAVLPLPSASASAVAPAAAPPAASAPALPRKSHAASAAVPKRRADAVASRAGTDYGI